MRRKPDEGSVGLDGASRTVRLSGEGAAEELGMQVESGSGFEDVEDGVLDQER